MFLLNHKFFKPFQSILSSLFSLSFLFLFVTFTLLLSPDIVHCFDRFFTWDANTESDLAGYRIYYKFGASGVPYNGTDADEGNSPIQIPLSSLSDPANPVYTIHGLSDTETYFFVITAYDTAGNESDFSNELSYQPSSPQPPPPNTNTSIIIDNGDPETSYTLQNWYNSNGPDYYGTQSVFSRIAGNKYTYDVALSGSYDISLWWTTTLSRCTAVPVEIYDGTTLVDTVTVSHQEKGGQWNPIGIGAYTFTGQAKVSIVSTGVGSCTTSADAVRFVSSAAPGNTAPISEITAPATGSSFNLYDSITFTGMVTDSEDGNISDNLSWRSNLDGVIGSGAAFSTSALSEGTHNITASVTDSDGLPGSATITVTVLSPQPPPPNTNTSIVIDNGYPGTSSTGSWFSSSGADYYGTQSLYSTTTVNGAYTYDAALNGSYDVYLWWTTHSSRCTAVPVEIYDGTTLLDTITVNHQVDGGQWNPIGIGPFTFTGQAKVSIVSTGIGNCSTNADAVRFESSETTENTAPVATIDSISPNPALADALITFTGHGDDLDGAILGYSWDSSIDGHLGDSATFTTSSPLSPGNHTISFTVVDDDIVETEPVTQTLIVQDMINEVIIDNQNFETYSDGANPDDWLDTAANNSMTEDDSLFKVFDLGGEMVYGTDSTQSNIHSHFVGAGSDSLAGYEYTGRMMITNDSGGIGVTFYSQYPNTDAYYRLRRYSNKDFHIEPHGTAVSGDINTGVVPLPNVWYRFKIQVEDTDSQTEIRAKVWQEGTGEPLDWQANAIDASSSRLMANTFGLWSYYSGSKYWDDLAVFPLSP